MLAAPGVNVEASTALLLSLIGYATSLAWSIIGCPSPGWAQLVFGEPDVERLWEAVAHVVRLDEADPVAAWRDHIARLRSRSAQLDARRFDALRFRGPGTDLLVGLRGSLLGCPARNTSPLPHCPG